MYCDWGILVLLWCKRRRFCKERKLGLAKSKTPLQATGYQACNAPRGGVFDPRGIRQLSVQARPLGSLPAGINGQAGMMVKANVKYR